jgi:hypothetical protein
MSPSLSPLGGERGRIGGMLKELTLPPSPLPPLPQADDQDKLWSYSCKLRGTSGKHRAPRLWGKPYQCSRWRNGHRMVRASHAEGGVLHQPFNGQLTLINPQPSQLTPPPHPPQGVGRGACRKVQRLQSTGGNIRHPLRYSPLPLVIVLTRAWGGQLPP